MPPMPSRGRKLASKARKQGQTRVTRGFKAQAQHARGHNPRSGTTRHLADHTQRRGSRPAVGEERCSARLAGVAPSESLDLPPQRRSTKGCEQVRAANERHRERVQARIDRAIQDTMVRLQNKGALCSLRVHSTMKRTYQDGTEAASASTLSRDAHALHETHCIILRQLLPKQELLAFQSDGLRIEGMDMEALEVTIRINGGEGVLDEKRVIVYNEALAELIRGGAVGAVRMTLGTARLPNKTAHATCDGHVALLRGVGLSNAVLKDKFLTWTVDSAPTLVGVNEGAMTVLLPREIGRAFDVVVPCRCHILHDAFKHCLLSVLGTPSEIREPNDTWFGYDLNQVVSQIRNMDIDFEDWGLVQPDQYSSTRWLGVLRVLRALAPARLPIIKVIQIKVAKALGVEPNQLSTVDPKTLRKQVDYKTQMVLGILQSPPFVVLMELILALFDDVTQPVLSFVQRYDGRRAIEEIPALHASMARAMAKQQVLDNPRAEERVLKEVLGPTFGVVDALKSHPNQVVRGTWTKKHVRALGSRMLERYWTYLVRRCEHMLSSPLVAAALGLPRWRRVLASRLLEAMESEGDEST